MPIRSLNEDMEAAAFISRFVQRKTFAECVSMLTYSKKDLRPRLDQSENDQTNLYLMQYEEFVFPCLLQEPSDNERFQLKNCLCLGPISFE